MSTDTVPQIKGYYETYWNKGKATFSGDQQGYAENFRRWMADEFRHRPKDSAVLEVGCGDGSFTKELAKHSNNVVAIDISESQLAENAERLKGITFKQHDCAERFPFETASFDVIWCSEVLEHLFGPKFALCEMNRLLKPGGRLLVTVPYHGRLKNLLIAMFNFDEHYTPSNPHIRFYTPNTISRITREAGFTGVATKTCGMNKPLRDLIVPTNILLSANKAA